MTSSLGLENIFFEVGGGQAASGAASSLLHLLSFLSEPEKQNPGQLLQHLPSLPPPLPGLRPLPPNYFIIMLPLWGSRPLRSLGSLGLPGCISQKFWSQGVSFL